MIGLEINMCNDRFFFFPVQYNGVHVHIATLCILPYGTLYRGEIVQRPFEFVAGPAVAVVPGRPEQRFSPFDTLPDGSTFYSASVCAKIPRNREFATFRVKQNYNKPPARTNITRRDIAKEEKMGVMPL